MAALRELYRRASGGLHGAAAERVEPRLRHAVGLKAQRDPDQVAAGGPAGRPGVRRPGQPAVATRRFQVVVEGREQNGGSSRMGYPQLR